MANIVTATQRHAEKQQTRTIEEKEAEMREEEFGVLPVARGAAEDAANEDDDEGPIYNPLNLPLGWDGKPIPFWLYKLHGLGVEYKCEICGNQSYWGRKAFDRHFQEWKHAHGMRCLGTVHL
jgi:splicing factor 3A subunit 3